MRRLVSKIIGARPVRVTINGTDSLQLPFELRSYRHYEPRAWATVMEAITPGAVFVDVGANVGLYSIAAAKRGARVVAFEPDPVNADILRRLARVNGVEIEIDQRACGDSEREIPFAFRASPVSGAADRYDGPTTRHGVVRSVRLDSVISAADVVKIDVEGYEGQVVSGMAGLLRESKPRLVVIEVHAAQIELEGESVDDVLRPLREAGYSFAEVGDAEFSRLAARLG